MIVHGFFVDGVLRGAADLRLNRSEAEVAFSIEKRWQSLGIGSALLERSLLAARNRGIKRLEVCCLVENQRMQQLARKFEAELTFDFGTVIGKMENPHPTPLSVMQEMAVDGHSFAAAYVDFQSRLLRRMGALVRLPQPCPLQVHSYNFYRNRGTLMKNTDQRQLTSDYAPYEAFWEGFVDYRHGLHSESLWSRPYSGCR